MQVTYKRLLEFRANAQGYIRMHVKEQTKFIYALNKVLSRTNELEKKYHERVADLRLDHAAVDKDGLLLTSEMPNGSQKYEFKPKDLKELNKLVRNLGEEKVDVEPYLCTGAIPDDVGITLQEIFDGFVLTYVDKEPEEEAPPASK